MARWRGTTSASRCSFDVQCVHTTNTFSMSTRILMI